MYVYFHRYEIVYKWHFIFLSFDFCFNNKTVVCTVRFFKISYHHKVFFNEKILNWRIIYGFKLNTQWELYNIKTQKIIRRWRINVCDVAKIETSICSSYNEQSGNLFVTWYFLFSEKYSKDYYFWPLEQRESKPHRLKIFTCKIFPNQLGHSIVARKIEIIWVMCFFTRLCSCHLNSANTQQ